MVNFWSWMSIFILFPRLQTILHTDTCFSQDYLVDKPLTELEGGL